MMPKLKILVIPLVECQKEIDSIVDNLKSMPYGSDIHVMVDDSKRSIKTKLANADSLDYDYAVIIGNDELRQGYVKLKDLVMRKERLCFLNELPYNFYPTLKEYNEDIVDPNYKEVNYSEIKAKERFITCERN